MWVSFPVASILPSGENRACFVAHLVCDTHFTAPEEVPASRESQKLNNKIQHYKNIHEARGYSHNFKIPSPSEVANISFREG